MDIFSILVGVLLCAYGNTQANENRNAPRNNFAMSPDRETVENHVGISFKRPKPHGFELNDRLNQNYYSILIKLRISVILRKNLIALLGFILEQNSRPNSNSVLHALYAVFNALRLRQVSSLELVSVLPEIANASPQQQLLTLCKKLEETAPPYLASYASVLVSALSTKDVDIDPYYNAQGEITPPDLYNGINKEAFPDLQSETTWSPDVPASVNAWVQSHLGTYYARILRSLAVGSLRPTHKLIVYLILNLPLERFDPDVNEAMDFIFDNTKQTLVVNDIQDAEIFSDPYNMARKYLETLKYDPDEFVGESADILTGVMYMPKEKPNASHFPTVSFKDNKFDVDFDRLFGLVSYSEFPQDVVLAKDRILSQVVRSGRYNIEGVLLNALLMYCEDDMDALAMVLERFMRRLPLPEDTLDAVKLVRSHVLALQRYRKGYDTGREYIFRGFADVSQYLETLCSKDPLRKVAKYLNLVLSRLPINWSNEFQYLPRMRIPRRSAGLMLQVLLRKSLVPDPRVNTVMDMFIESKFPQMNWTYIQEASKIWYTDMPRPPHLNAKFEIVISFKPVNLTNSKDNLPDKIKNIPVSIVDSRIELNTKRLCVYAIKFKATNPQILENIENLLNYLPDLNNPNMFWSVKTFFTFNYKNVFDNDFNVCLYDSPKPLLQGIISKAIGLESVARDKDLRDALVTYSNALDSEALHVDLGPAVYFLAEPTMRPLLPKHMHTIPQDLDNLRPLIKLMYTEALQIDFNSTQPARFKKLEILFKQYVPNYDLSDFSLNKIEEANPYPNKLNFGVMQSILEPKHLLKLLGPNFDKSISKTPKELLRQIIHNILKNNAAILTQPSKDAFKYYLDLAFEVPTIINLDDIPQISKEDKYLPVLKEILRWDRLRPFLNNDFAYPDRATTLDQLKYIIDYVLSHNPEKMSKTLAPALQHFQSVLNNMEPLPIIDVTAIPGLTLSLSDSGTLNKVLQLHNLIKFLPPNFVYQDSSTPKTQLKNIIDALTTFSKTQLKKPTLMTLSHYQGQLVLSLSEMVIDVNKINEIHKSDPLLRILKDILRKDKIYQFIPPEFHFEAALSPKQQLVKILRVMKEKDSNALNQKLKDVIDHFLRDIDNSEDLNSPVLATEEIPQICPGDELLPTLKEMLTPKVLWNLVDRNYKEPANVSPKEKLMDIIKNILKVSSEILSKKQFDAAHHFEDILEYGDACQNLPPIVNLTLVPQIPPNDINIPVLNDILRIDILSKLIGEGYYFPADAEPQYLLKTIINEVLRNSIYKLKPQWLNVMLYFKNVMQNEVFLLEKHPALQNNTDLDVIVELLKKPNLTEPLDLKDKTFGAGTKRVVKVLNVLKKKINFLDNKNLLKKVDNLLQSLNNRSENEVLDTDGIDGVYWTNPHFPTLYSLLHQPELVKSLAPHYEEFPGTNNRDKLMFMIRDVISTNSTMLTPVLRDTLNHFYDLLTATTPYLATNIYSQNDINDAITGIEEFRNEPQLPVLKMILLNPNLPTIHKLSMIAGADQPSKIIKYIINTISTKYPALEMDGNIKGILDHFRAILDRKITPMSMTSDDALLPKMTMSTYIPVPNTTLFLTEAGIHIKSIANPTESERFTKILHIPNVIDMLEISRGTLYKGSPAENTLTILSAIKSHMDVIQMIIPEKSINQLTGVFEKLNNVSSLIKPQPLPVPKIMKSKIPNAVQSEMNNVIQAFIEVPEKEIITMAMKIEDVTTLLNLSVDTMRSYTPDEKLYYFAHKLHENIPTISKYFPGKDIDSVTEKVISILSPSFEGTVPDLIHNFEGQYIPNLNEVVHTMHAYIPGSESDEIANLLRKRGVSQILGLDSVIMRSNSPQQNLIYIFHKINDAGDKIQAILPLNSTRNAIQAVLSTDVFTTQRPYEVTTPITFSLSIFKDEVFQSIQYIAQNYDSNDKDELISILHIPGLGSILDLNKTLLAGYTPKEKVMYIFQKVAENLSRISRFIPDVNLSKVVGTFVDKVVGGSFTVPATSLGPIINTIQRYHSREPNVERIIDIVSMPDIQKAIHLNISSITSSSPLENMITIFKGIERNIESLSKFLPKEDMLNSAKVVLKEDIKPSVVMSGIEGQIDKFFKGKPEDELLLKLTKIPDITNLIDSNMALMKYMSPLEGMISFFQDVKKNIDKISTLLPSKDLKTTIASVLKEDGANMTALLTPIKSKIETMYIPQETKDLVNEIVKFVDKMDATNLNIPLMKYNTPLENLIYIFNKIKQNVTILSKNFPHDDVYSAIKTILREDEKETDYLKPEILNQVNYFFTNHPEKELMQIIEMVNVVDLFNLNTGVIMKYNSPRDNMLYFFRQVKEQTHKVSEIFDVKDIQNAVRNVLKEDGNSFSELLAPINRELEVYFHSSPQKPALSKIVALPNIEQKINFNIPSMRYNSPLENMIYFFQRIKEEVPTISKLVPEKDILSAVQTVLPVNEMRPTVAIFSVTQVIEEFYKGHPDYPLLVSVMAIPKISRVININVPLMYYFTPLENMIYYFQTVKDNIEKLKSMFPGTKFEQAVKIILKEDEKPLEAMLAAIRKKIEFFFGNHPDKNTIMKITQLPNILATIGVNVPFLKYVSPLEGMIAFFQKINDNIKTVSKLLPNDDVKSVVKTVLKPDETLAVTLFKPIARLIDMIYKKHPDKDLMLAITKIPNIEDVARIDSQLVKYQTPLENLIYFFQNVKRNINQISSLFPTSNVKNVVGTILKDNGIPVETFLKPIREQVLHFYGNKPMRDEMLQITNIPGILQKLNLNIPLMNYLSPLENMIYFFQTVGDDLSVIDSEMFAPGVTKKAIRTVLKEDEKLPIEFSKLIKDEIQIQFGKHQVEKLLTQIVSVPDIGNQIGINEVITRYQTPLENMIYFFQNVKNNKEKVETLLPGTNIDNALSIVLKENENAPITFTIPILRKVLSYYDNHPAKEVFTQIMNISDIEQEIFIKIPLMKYKPQLENMIYFFEKVDENIDKVSQFLPGKDVVSALATILKEAPKGIETVLQPVKDQINIYYPKQPENSLLLQIASIPDIFKLSQVSLPVMLYQSPLENLIYFFQNVKDNTQKIQVYAPGIDIKKAVAIVTREDVKDTNNYPKTDSDVKDVVVQQVRKYHNTSDVEVMVRIAEVPDIVTHVHVDSALMRYLTALEKMIYFFKAVKENKETVSTYVPDVDVEKVSKIVLKEDILKATSIIAPIVDVIEKYFAKHPAKQELIQVTKIPDIENMVQLNIPVMNYYSPLLNMVYFFERVEDNIYSISRYLPDTNIGKTLAVVLKKDAAPFSTISKPIIQQVLNFLKKVPETNDVIQIVKYEDIDKALLLCTAFMKYNPPLENMIYFFETVRDNIQQVSSILPGKDIKKIVNVVLKEDSGGFEALIPSIVSQITKHFPNQPQSQLLIQILNIPKIETIIGASVPLMKYYYPLENLIYFFQKVKYSTHLLSNLLPGKDINSALDVIFSQDKTPLLTRMTAVKQQISLYHNSYQNKDLLIRVTDLPDIENLLHLNQDRMSFQSPLENMVYVFQSVRNNIDKFTGIFPDKNFQGAVSTVLQDDVKFTSLIKSIDKLIEKLFRNNPEKVEMLKITSTPDLDLKLNLNVPLMTYMSPLENMVYLFQRAKDNIALAGGIIPEKVIDSAIEMITNYREIPKETLFATLFQQVDTHFSKHPLKEMIVEMAHIPGLDYVTNLDTPFMRYLSPLENMIYVFKTMKDDVNQIAGFYPARDVENAVAIVLRENNDTTAIFPPITKEIQRFYDKQPDMENIVKIVNADHLEKNVGLNIPLMKYLSPLENMIYIFEKVEDNLEKVSGVFPTLDVKKLVSTVLKADDVQFSTIVQPIAALIATHYDKQPDKDILTKILMKPDIENIIHIMVPVMRYNTLEQNTVYFFQKVKDSIKTVSTYFPGIDVPYIVSTYLESALQNISSASSPQSDLPIEIISQIKQKIHFHFQNKPEAEVLVKILDVKRIEFSVHLNMSQMNVSGPLENMIYFFSKVKDNINDVSVLVPGSDIKKAISTVLSDDVNGQTPQDVFQPIVDKITQIYDKHPSLNIMISLIKSPKLTKSLNLSLPLMKYLSPEENLVYIFHKIKANIHEFSGEFSPERLAEAISTVLMEDIPGSSMFQSNPGTIISTVISQIKERFPKESDSEIMLRIANIPGIVNVINLNIPVMMRSSPLEKLIGFFEAVKDNIAKAAMFLPREDVERAIATVLMESVRDKLLKENKPNVLTTQIKETIQKYHSKNPEVQMLMKIADLNDIHFAVHLNDAVMMYSSPLENLIYFFTKVKDEKNKVSQYLGGMDITAALKSVLRQDLSSSSMILSQPIPALSMVVEMIENYYKGHPDIGMLTRLPKDKDIVQNINLNVPFMSYLSPLEKMMHFFKCVRDNIASVTKYVPELQVKKTLSIIFREDFKDVYQNPKKPLKELLPEMVQQIDYYYGYSPEKEMISQLMRMPGIEDKIGLDLSLMAYLSPLEKVLYFFTKTKENIPVLSIFLPGTDIKKLVDRVLRDTDSPNRSEYFLNKIRERIEMYNEAQEDKSLLLKITKIPDIITAIHASVPLMEYLSPLENYVYFFKKLEESQKDNITFLTPAEVENAINIVVYRKEKPTHFQQSIYSIFPIEKQIVKYFKSPSENEMMIKILKIPKVENAISLSIPLMTYQSPFENMVYFFRKVKDSSETVSAFLPVTKIQNVLNRVLRDDLFNTSVILSPIAGQISKYVDNPADRNVLMKILNITNVERVIDLVIPLMDYQRPLEKMVYFFQKVKDEIEKVSVFVPDSNLKKAVSTVLREDVPISSYLFTPIVDQIKYFFKQSPYEDILVHITKIPAITQTAHVNIPLIKYQSPLENMIYFFEKVDEDIHKISTIHSWNDINEAIKAVFTSSHSMETFISPILSQIETSFPNATERNQVSQLATIPYLESVINLNSHYMAYLSPVEKMIHVFQEIKDDIKKLSVMLPRNEVERVVGLVLNGKYQLTTTLLGPIFQEIETYFGKGPVETTFSQAVKIPGLEKIIGLNVPLMHYITPLESMIYVFEQIKENIKSISAFLPDKDLENTIAAVLKENEKNGTALNNEILQEIQLFYQNSPIKDMLIEVASIPRIEHELYFNIPFMKYKSPLENFVYFFQKVNEDIPKISKLLPRRDVRKVVSSVLKLDQNMTVTVYLPIIRKIEYLYKGSPDQSTIIKIVNTPDIAQKLRLNVPLMTYFSPLENMVYFFQMVKNKIQEVSALYQGDDVKKIVTSVLKEEEMLPSAFFQPIVQQIETFYYKQPDKDTMIGIINVKDIARLLGLNVPLMKYYTPMENMIYLFKKIKDNVEKLSTVFPGKDLKKIVGVILKEDDQPMMYILSAIKQQIEILYSYRPSDKDLLVSAVQVPDIEFLVNLDTPLMRYYSPLENMIYVFQKFNESIDKVSAVFPSNYIKEAVAIALRENEGTSTFLFPIRKQIETFVHDMGAQELSLKITKYDNIEKIIHANIPLMRYYRPLESMIHLFQRVKEERDRVSELFPGQNVSRGVSVVLKEDNAPLESLMIPIIQQVEYFYGDLPDKVVINLLQSPEIQRVMVLNIPLMKYQSPLENMIYVFQNVKANMEYFVKRVPNMDLKRMVAKILKEDTIYQVKPEFRFQDVNYQISTLVKPYDKETALKLTNISSIGEKMNLNIPRMSYNSPLENLIYFFSMVKDNIPKITSFLPSADVERTVSSILNNDGKQLAEILNSITQQIEKLYGQHPDKSVLVKILKIPEIKSVIFLNHALMTYMPDLENMIYFFENVKHNIETISAYVPKADVIRAVALVLKENGPSFASLSSQFPRHIEIFYANKSDKKSILQVLRTPNVVTDMNINVPLMRYKQDLENLMYFYKKVLDKNYYVSSLFPDNDAEKAITRFLVEAEKYINSTTMSSSDQKPADITFIISQILEQISYHFNQNPNKQLLEAIAKIPAIESIIGLDIPSMKLSAPLENLLHFLKLVAANVDKITAFFPDQGQNGKPGIDKIMMDVLDAIHRKNPPKGTDTSTKPEQSPTVISSVPDKELLIETITSYVPENDKEWIASMLNLNDIVSVLGLDTNAMKTLTPIQSSKYILGKAKEHMQSLSVYFPGKDMMPLITHALKQVESNSPISIRRHVQPEKVARTVPAAPSSPLYESLPQYLESVIRAIPKDVSLTSIMMFATLLKTPNFMTNLNIPESIITSYTPRHLLEVIIDLVLRNPDIMSDSIIQNAIQEIARSLVKSDGQGFTAVTPAFNVSTILSYIPAGLLPEESTTIRNFLQKPDLFSVLNVNEDLNSFLFHFPTPIKQLKTLLYRAASSPDLPEKLEMVIVKTLGLLKQTEIVPSSHDTSVLHVVLSLPESVNMSDVTTVVGFLKTHNLLQQIGFTPSRSDFASDNEYANEILSYCKQIPSIIQNKPLYESIIAVMKGIEQAKCSMTDQTCKAPELTFEKMVDILGLDDNSGQLVMDILRDCKATQKFKDEASLTIMKKLFSDVYASDVVRKNQKYAETVKSILNRLGVNTENENKPDFASLISLIPKETSNYAQLVKFFEVVDFPKLLGQAFVPSNYKSPHDLLVNIVEQLLNKVISKDYGVLYDSFKDLFHRLKKVGASDYDILIDQLITQLPNINNRGVLESFLQNNDILQMLGKKFDINIYQDQKSKLYNLLKAILQLDKVKEDILLEGATKQAISVLENAQSEVAVDMKRIYNFTKLMELLDRSQNPEYYDKLKGFIKRPDLRARLGPTFNVQDFKTANSLLKTILEMSLRLKLYGNDTILRLAIEFYLLRIKQEKVEVAISEAFYTVKTVKVTQSVDLNEVFNALDIDKAADNKEALTAIKEIFEFFKPDSSFVPDIHMKGFDVGKFSTSNGIFLQAFFNHLDGLSDKDVPPSLKASLKKVYPYISLTGAGAIPVETTEETQTSGIDQVYRGVEIAQRR